MSKCRQTLAPSHFPLRMNAFLNPSVAQADLGAAQSKLSEVFSDSLIAASVHLMYMKFDAVYASSLRGLFNTLGEQ